MTTRYHGWHWWNGVGNDCYADGSRPEVEKNWVVLCWTFGGIGFASSACWAAPMKQSEMGGKWGEEVLPEYN